MTKFKPLIIQLLFRLWGQINSRCRRNLLFLMILILLTSLAEIISIGSIVPFLGALTAPEKVYGHILVKPIIDFLEIKEPSQIMLLFSIFFGLAVLISGIMRLLLLWSNTKISYSIGTDFGANIYRRTLLQEYIIHCSRNSNEIINSIANKTTSVIGIINMILSLISSAVILVSVVIVSFLISPLISCSIFLSVALIYTFIVKLNKKQLLLNSESIAKDSDCLVKSLNEGLGGIRDVIINGSENIYCQAFRKADTSLRRAQSSNVFLVNSPRYLIETLAMILIIFLAYFFSMNYNGGTKTVPILGLIALGAQRLLPIFQQGYGSWSTILGSQKSLQDVLELLEQTIPDDTNKQILKVIPFKNYIYLNQIYFRYNLKTSYVLKAIDFKINKGDRIGLIGSTGSGKSTLFDIIMGLLEPSKGSLEIDGKLISALNKRAWQSHIAQVSQTIFLTDSTIKENIAFGIPKHQINLKRVKQAASRAQISHLIESWPEKYKTFVGENGIRLSGGQRQRIAIARALYKKADLIIFDEATSSLDNETEQSVMDSIVNLNKDITLLFIAHRISSLKNCTQILELSHDGTIKQIENYKSIINKKA